MRYSDNIKSHNKGTLCEQKEVTANVELSMGDLVQLKAALEGFLSIENIEHSTKKWALSTLEDIKSSLNKL
ncbi:hypothetical protein SAMN04489761_4279 [Tenacibaculum sp. MAR_2009_124]|uniref:hypothetical protein n=1 Tax=Tenacibaculum sp. MAR_2009_124 TaxID=1250059 RepID=UPI00089BCC56|nr:hypothetical protein [Tenacibaculum sp. MAR_2009_124]SED10203.1 hypothetical protein SAMN04489761_4279 [Tenacibaculum sp. MAR_2009_124]